MGLCKKAVDIALKANAYNELCGMLTNFIDTKTSQQITLNVSQNLADDLIANPVVFTQRRRPPNRYKSSLEVVQSKSKRVPLSDISSDKNVEGNGSNQSELETLDIHKPRQCKNCKGYGHYSKTCPNK